MTKQLKIILGSVVLGACALAVSVFAGMSDGGQINVNTKIESSNSTAEATGAGQVQTNSQAVEPNGGLRGKGKSPTPVSAPAPEPEPLTEDATTTVQGSATAEDTTTDGDTE